MKPNPAVNHVHNGFKGFKKEECDFVITAGGGSSRDCGSAIANLATNGGHITENEGVGK